MENYAGKTIMILGAGQLQVPILQRAKEKGLRVVVVSPGVDDPGFAYADVIVPLDVRDEEGILAAAKRYGVDGVVTDQTDLPVRTAAYVSDKLGLPGIGYELGCLFTDKYHQREVCAEAGLPVPKFQMVRNVQEAEIFFETCGGVIIMKPIDSQASHGVSKVTDRSEIARAFDRAVGYTRNGQVLMEEWIDGVEYSVDSFVSDGEVRVLAIGQYHPFNIPNAFSSAYTVFPPNTSQEIVDRIEAMNAAVVKAFGYENGRTHAEFLVTETECYLIEIAARGGGAYFSSDNVRFVSGFCTEEYLINFALGLPQASLSESTEKYGCCCTLFFYLPENGVVVQTDGVERVREWGFVKRNNLDQVVVGLKSRPIIDKGARYFMILTAKDHEELEERMLLVRDTLRIVTETADGQRLLPIWG